MPSLTTYEMGIDCSKKIPRNSIRMHLLHYRQKKFWNTFFPLTCSVPENAPQVQNFKYIFATV